jgi:hypothetical protein
MDPFLTCSGRAAVGTHLVPLALTSLGIETTVIIAGIVTLIGLAVRTMQRAISMKRTRIRAAVPQPQTLNFMI